ncbi:MAG: RNase P subunit p30 family protein [Candidatus Bathyarchaeia archaeon]
MVKYIDLHLKKPARPEDLRSMLRYATRLGYGAIGLASSDSPNLRDIGRELDIEIVTRIDLRPESGRELLRSLSSLRWGYEVVAVECTRKEVARQAAKDHRVDILNFSPSPNTRVKVWFDRQEATLASEAGCALEINISDILTAGPIQCAKLLSVMRVEIENARREDVPVIISSGADSPRLMRGPREIVALLDLLSVEEGEGKEMISRNPLMIVERNRGKMAPGFIAPGVRVVGDAR